MSKLSQAAKKDPAVAAAVNVAKDTVESLLLAFIQAMFHGHTADQRTDLLARADALLAPKAKKAAKTNTTNDEE